MRQVSVLQGEKRKESPLVSKSKPLIEERVAVHRLHRLGLVDEKLQKASVNQVVGAGGIDDQVRPLNDSYDDVENN